MAGFPPFAFIGSAGPGEFVVVFVVILLLFGPKRLPEIARTLGRVFDQLRRASQDFKDQVMQIDQVSPPVAPRAAVPEPNSPDAADGAPGADDEPEPDCGPPSDDGPGGVPDAGGPGAEPEGPKP